MDEELVRDFGRQLRGTYRIPFCSPVGSFSLLFSFFLMIPKIFSLLLHNLTSNTLLTVLEGYDSLFTGLFWLGLVLLLLILIIVVYTRYKRVPLSWRLREEVKRFFYDQVLMVRDKKELNQYLFIEPIIKNKRDDKTKIVKFRINSPRFTEDVIEQLKNPFNFRHAQAVDVEENLNSSGQLVGYILKVNYDTESNMFNQQLGGS